MKKNGNWAALSLGITLTFAASGALGARVARADVNDVTGMDYVIGTKAVGDEQSDEEPRSENMIDFCSITYDGEDAVYVELKKGERKIASHLYYPLPLGKEGSTGARVGVLSLEIPSFDPSADYSIGVYADHNQKTQLFEGTIKPVYADVDGQPHLIAIRTIGAKENDRNFSAPNIITIGDAAYARKGNKATSENPLTYTYELTDGTSVDATVTYVDEQGNEIKSVKVATLAAGQSKEYEIPATVIVGEGASTQVWRTVSYTGKVNLSFPGQSEYTITCKALIAPEGSGIEAVGSFYVAKIKLVDEEGKTLGSDSLNVTSPYLYTPPTMLHVNSGGQVVDYKLSESNSSLSANGVLELDPLTDGVTTGSKTIDIAYTKLDDSAPRTWTIVYENGSLDPKDEHRVIKTKTFEVLPGETATFNPESSILVDGKTYVPVTSTKEEYTYTHGEIPEDGKQSVYPKLTVYYVPDGYKQPEPYEIKVNYVNIANSEVIESHTLTSRPEDRDELEIKSPATFTNGGVEYVRLNGQEQSIWHSFYSSARTYNIYYRDINDDLHADTTITRVEVEYEDGETTTTNNGTNTINDGTTTNDGGTNYVDGGTNYTDGGTTTTGGRTNNAGGGTTTNDGGTTYTDGGTNYTDGATTYVDGAGGRTTTDGGATNGGVTDGGTTNYGGGAPAVADGGTAAGAGNAGAGNAGAGNANRASVPTDAGALTVINDGDGNATMTDSAGRDTNTMRIDDDATPLAGPNSENGSAVADAGSKLNVGALTGAIAALGIALAGLLFWFFRLRQKDEEEEDASDTSEA